VKEAPDPQLRVGARVIDRALETTVVGSFSKIGPAIRHRTARWATPPAAAGRMIVVTGATSGLGLAAARELARLGASLCLVGRDRQRTERAKKEVEAAAGGAVRTELADFDDLDEVAALSDRLMDRLDRIDVLAHVAGALFRQRRTSRQGVEATVNLHLLAPFVLSERLRPLLVAAAPARVITMTSGGMYAQGFALNELVMAEAEYDGTIAYARAKRAQVVLTHEWQRRYGQSGVTFHATHPGWADTPGLTSGLPAFARVARPLLRSASAGADTLVWLAGSPGGSPEGGRLWLDRRARGEYYLPWTWVPPARRATDGRALWEWCREQTVSQRPTLP
jgi:NAD(P)-dependent dehydrogenase (short-subunit alcohol dehydrogenase family)